jgi:hypothetical protein
MLVIPVETPIDCGGLGLQEIVEAYDKRKKIILDGGFSYISLYDDLLATIHANLSCYLSEASNFGQFC